MIGLGTGSTNRSIKREQWDKYGSLGVVDPVNNLPLINMFFHASETALSHSLIHELGDDLYMFNKSILDGDPTTPNTQIDDGSPENLKKLRNFSEAIMEEPKTKKASSPSFQAKKNKTFPVQNSASFDDYNSRF